MENNPQENTPQENPRPRLDPDQIRKIALDEMQKPTEDHPNNMLNIKRSYEWIEEAMKMPIPQMLFDEFWYEGEICILFADTNTGKSILAVQIADSISTGLPINGFRMEAGAQPVMYLDFELSAKQFELRYSVNYTNHYPWHPNKYRADMKRGNPMPDGCETYEDCLMYSIEDAALNRNIKVLVIDNLTYLLADNERARDANPLMQKLMQLKDDYNLSMLILAHTPKRDLSTPITVNHLQGSKALMNFCDSSFCIGTSTQEKSLRYLKQIKVRTTEHRYTADNVALCRIEKPHNFLRFAHMGYCTEREHLREREERDKAELIRRAKELKEEGKTFEEIGAELGISKSSAERYVKK